MYCGLWSWIVEWYIEWHLVMLRSIFISICLTKLNQHKKTFINGNNKQQEEKKEIVRSWILFYFLKIYLPFSFNWTTRVKRDHSVCEWKNHSDFIFLDFNRALDSFTFFFIKNLFNNNDTTAKATKKMMILKWLTIQSKAFD